MRRSACADSHRGPAISVTASSISIPVATWLQQPRAGTVLATFARSAYLDFGDAIVAIVGAELLNGPLNVVLAEGAVPPFDQLTAGSHVTASEETIQADGWPAIALRGATRWDPRIAPWARSRMRNVTGNVDVLRGTIATETPTDHLKHPRMQQALAALRSALGKESPADVRGVAASLAGLGAGLTPSGDDVLVGALVALAALPDDHAAVRGAIRDASAGRTTRISAEYLRAAARGEASEAWQRLLTALAGDAADDLIEAGRRVVAFGETSGADMLTGFLLAIESTY